jgi:hypothetical protein
MDLGSNFDGADMAEPPGQGRASPSESLEVGQRTGLAAHCAEIG